MSSFIDNWRKELTHHRSLAWLNVILLLAIIGIGLAVRLSQPVHDRSIGEIDVYYWALRTQEFLLHGWSGIGTSLWVTPVIMGTLHLIIRSSIYDLFLWVAPVLTAIFPTLAIYFLTKELTRSKIAALVSAFAFAILPIVLYRGVFTVSETFAYIFLPWTLYFCVRVLRRMESWAFVAMIFFFIVMLQTHDSAKLLALPVGLTAAIFFWKSWSRRLTKVLFSISVVAIVAALLLVPSILSGIKFFLFPTTHGNSAFGKYAPLQYSEYVDILPALFSLYALCGAILWVRFTRGHRLMPLLLLAFLLPIIYYQQIQPRISDSTIVPFRLTPYLAFAAAPLFGVAMAGWLRLRSRSRRSILPIVLIGFFLLIPQVSVANFSLPFVTGVDEQQSLQKLPVTTDDYLITQTSMIGMTALATKTNEQNYYGDTDGKVFAGQTAVDILRRLHQVSDTEKKKPTGVLISLWKLRHHDQNFGWFDSLMNPYINITAWRATGLPIRFEDRNIIIFTIPKNF